MCNVVLNPPVVESVTVEGYADDIQLVLITKPLENAEFYSWETISAVA